MPTQTALQLVTTTVVPSVEEGLRALAEGVKVVGAAMQAKADPRSDTALSQGVIASLGRQEEALKQQTAAINELIRTLRGDK
ncbi:hypothetical protein F441_07717 [Phytophthora nicotianae CJ01A1]|uniref:Uncharacterized protein n=1 Tax=Phytophthora nicotianae CJ01A1 TaxID=1317063 RepID=W2X7U4_PHYNI|nr:hypothetical protein F441_07717 [Phytophthora nicotianae CJ01A1]